MGASVRCSTAFYTWLLSQVRNLGVTFSPRPCPQGSCLDCANHRPACQMWKVEKTHHIPSAVAVCECEVSRGFQASSCKSASSARQAAELSGIQLSRTLLTASISWRSAAVFCSLDYPRLCIQRLCLLLIPLLSPSYLRYLKLFLFSLLNPNC